MATSILTFEPDGHPESTSGDGFAGHAEASSNWDGVHGGAGNISEDALTYLSSLIRAQNVTDKWQQILRAIIVIDISSIPPGTTITAVKLRLRCAAKWDELSISTPAAGIVESSPTSNTAVRDSDYGNFGTLACSAEKAYGDVTVSYYNEFIFQSYGIAVVQNYLDGDGIVKLGIREYNFDVLNRKPRWVSHGIAGFNWQSVESGSPPQLVITFTNTTEVRTDGPTDLEPTTATLNGTLVTDGGEACDCGFEWGITTEYGNTTSTQSKETDDTFSQGITGLTQFATYHYRAFATNVFGTVYGTDIEFRSGEPWSPKGDRAGVTRVVEERLHYSDAYGHERWILGTLVPPEE